MGAWLVFAGGADGRVRWRAGGRRVAVACHRLVLVVGVLALVPTSAGAAGWAIQATPNPDGATSSSLRGVSCASPSACMAVGSSDGTPLAESWNGSSWVIKAIPNLPAGSIGGELNGVSCTSANDCIAVGYYTNVSATAASLAEHWNGSTWEIQSTPNPTGAIATSLNAVSCTSVNDCIAVGYYTNVSVTPASLAEHWNGSTWEIQSTPNPTGAIATSLTGVSCGSASACTAVGSYTVVSNLLFSISRTLAERWDGSTWVIQPTPNPAALNTNVSAHVNQLNGVSCSRALLVSGCTAVGYYDDNSGNPRTLAENWNGGRWSVQPTPNPSPPSNALSVLRAVTCTFALLTPRCTAVGGQGVPAASQFAFRRRGLTWTVQPMPLPAPASSPTYPILWGVSCTSANACTAVGSYIPPGSLGDVTLAERYS